MQENIKYQNTEQAASYTGISVSTLTKARLFGGGPKFFKVGRRVVYATTDLDDWVQSRRFSSTSEYLMKGAR